MRWTRGEKPFRRTWNDERLLHVNAVLSLFNKTRPKEIHRKIRSLNDIKHWKGTEFRTFLLYLGVVILKRFLPRDEYILFLKLQTAVTICFSDRYRAYLPKARELYVEFIEDYINIYGADSITSNIHNLAHVVDDVEQFGNLNEISSYIFENKLHCIKLQLKQCHKPLEQIARRLGETPSNVIEFNEQTNFIPQVKYEFNMNDQSVFKEVLFQKNSVLTIRNEFGADRWFLSNNNKIVQFEYALYQNNSILLCGSAVREQTDFFKEPFSSRYLNIFKSNCDKLPSEFYKIEEVKSKLFCLPFGIESVFLPLLHTL